MPRRARQAVGGLVYHVLNRGNLRAPIFHKGGDYEAYERILELARERTPVDIFAWCLMPNHWHLVVRPHKDGDLAEFMRWLTVTHTQRWRAHSHTEGQGHLYQGRYKSFPVQSDRHFLGVCRYVERNALKAGLAARAEDWRWSSLWRRVHGEDRDRQILSPWPVDRPGDWLERVNRPMRAGEEEAIRQSVRRGRPYGDQAWQTQMAADLDLEHTFRGRGRPKKKKEQKE
jgi:putative transposase